MLSENDPFQHPKNPEITEQIEQHERETMQEVLAWRIALRALEDVAGCDPYKTRLDDFLEPSNLAEVPFKHIARQLRHLASGGPENMRRHLIACVQSKDYQGIKALLTAGMLVPDRMSFTLAPAFSEAIDQELYARRQDGFDDLTEMHGFVDFYKKQLAHHHNPDTPILIVVAELHADIRYYLNEPIGDFE